MSRKTPVQAAFLSTLSLRRATILSPLSNSATYISIHALLAESDGLRRRDLRSYLGYFYPRSPCGERHWAAQQYAKAQTISIHALLAESDPARMLSTRRSTLFLSTLSLRRATLLFYITSALRQISIHALLAESDRARAAEGASARIFLSTLSLRRATVHVAQDPSPGRISIHALLAESDGVSTVDNGVTQISIHALLAESDRSPAGALHAPYDFYPRSPCGERLCVTL